jgi:hypothetical protein
MDKATKRLVVGGAVAGSLMLGAAGLVIGAGIGIVKGDTFYPSGNKGDMSVSEVRYDVSTVNSRYATTMPDDMPQVTCGALRRGASEASIASMGTSSGIPADVVRILVFSSEWHFCPEYY